MESILITLNYAEGKDVDLRVSSYFTVNDFVEIIQKHYGVNGTALQAEPLGILLNGKQTFVEQQVENGALLTLHN